MNTYISNALESTRIKLTKETVFGKDIELTNLDKMQGIIVRIRKSDDVEESKNTLIAMLEELIRNEDIASKKKKLVENFGLIMTKEMEEANTMCNISEGIFEDGFKDGFKAGEERGEARGKNSLITQMLRNGLSADEISSYCDIPVEEIKKIQESMLISK